MSLLDRAGPSYGAARSPRDRRPEASPRPGVLGARGAAALLVGLAVVGVALAPRASHAGASPLLRADSSHNGTSERARSPGGVSFPNGTAAVYKRTHACTNARADAHWLQRYVGLTVDVAASKTLEGDACMVRTSGTSAGEWSVHDVETQRFHTGEYAPYVWWYYLRTMHGPFTADSFHGWNQFMAYSTGFYVKDLSWHLERWATRAAPSLSARAAGLAGSSHFSEPRAPPAVVRRSRPFPPRGARYENESVQHLRFKYENPADGNEMYAALLFNAFTGEVVEIHAGQVDSARFAASFDELPEGACFDGFALTLPRTYMDVNFMARAYSAGRSHERTAAGLPWPMPWKLSWPTSDVTKPLHWFDSNLPDYTSMRYQACGSGCHLAEMMLKLSESLVTNGTERMRTVQTPVLVRFVQNNDAGTSGLPWGVRDFEEYVEAVHERYVGEQAGWDRWLDNHIGLEIDNEAGLGFLDHVGAQLERNGVKFHAHTTQRDDTTVGAAGSIWTQGVAGLGLEIHGAFDWSWFNQSGPHALHGMSMCGHNSEEPLVASHDGANASDAGAPRAGKLDGVELAHDNATRPDDTDASAATPPAPSFDSLGEADVLAGLADAIASMRLATRKEAARPAARP